MAAAARRPAAVLLLLLVAVALLGGADAKKKSPAKKVGFLKTAEKRSKYATWVFQQYDENDDAKLSEDEVDTANSDEPLVQITKDVEDTLELFDLDLLDKDPVDKKVSRVELLTKLETVEEARLLAIETWKIREETEKEMWKDFDRLHTVTEMATNPTVRVMTGGSRMTHQRKEKIEPEDMEWMIKKYGKSLGMNGEQMWNFWADFCGQRRSTKNAEYEVEQGRAAFQQPGYGESAETEGKDEV